MIEPVVAVAPVAGTAAPLAPMVGAPVLVSAPAGLRKGLERCNRLGLQLAWWDDHAADYSAAGRGNS